MNDSLNTSPLAGSVKLYQRHLIVCTGRTNWPARIEEGGGFLPALDEAVRQQAAVMPLAVKLTACDDYRNEPGYDILVFPDSVRYLGVLPADIPALVEDHLVGGQISPQIPHEPAPGHYLCVCVHAGRDERCGRTGPELAAAFEGELAARQLLGRVTLLRTSHVGGHALAGNVLIYPGGDWYGRVTAADAPRIIEQHLLGGELIWELWRGRLGLAPADQLALAGQR